MNPSPDNRWPGTLARLTSDEGWSHARAAGECGVSTAAMSYYMQGRRVPSVRAIGLLAAGFGMTTDALRALVASDFGVAVTVVCRLRCEQCGELEGVYTRQGDAHAAGREHLKEHPGEVMAA